MNTIRANQIANKVAQDLNPSTHIPNSIDLRNRCKEFELQYNLPEALGILVNPKTQNLSGDELTGLPDSDVIWLL